MRLHPAEWIRESAGYMKEKNKTGNWLLNAVYPRRCPICDGLLSREELYLCRNCVEKIHPILGARCKKCGKPVGSEEEFCRDCSRTRHSFDRGFRCRFIRRDSGSAATIRRGDLQKSWQKKWNFP